MGKNKVTENIHEWTPGMAFKYVGDDVDWSNNGYTHYFCSHDPLGSDTPVFVAAYPGGYRRLHWDGLSWDYERLSQYDIARFRLLMR